MNEMTKIVWSGFTGRTGREAVMASHDMPDVEITLGITRDACRVMEVFGESIGYTEWVSYDMSVLGLADLVKQRAKADIIIDFSHPDVFELIVELAVRTHVPLISGTSGLSNRQMAMLYDATNQIPVFRGGNFRFKVKKFIDEAVEFAQNEPGQLELYENFWKGKELPSETSKVIQKRILEATGREVKVRSSTTFAQDNRISDWKLRVQRRVSPTAMHRNGLHCRVVGYDELAHDVLEIAKIMKNKPVKKGEFYDLDEIWDEIPVEARFVS